MKGNIFFLSKNFSFIFFSTFSIILIYFLLNLGGRQPDLGRVFYKK